MLYPVLSKKFTAEWKPGLGSLERTNIIIWRFLNSLSQLSRKSTPDIWKSLCYPYGKVGSYISKNRERNGKGKSWAALNDAALRRLNSVPSGWRHVYPAHCQFEVTCHFLNCIFEWLRSTASSVMIKEKLMYVVTAFGIIWNVITCITTCILNETIMAILDFLHNTEMADTISLFSSCSLITNIRLLLGKTDYVIVISLVVAILHN